MSILCSVFDRIMAVMVLGSDLTSGLHSCGVEAAR